MFSKSIHTHCTLFVCIVFIIFTGAQGQQIPSLNDPFPADPGPELVPTTLAPYQGCPVACSVRLDEAMAVINDLERRMTTLNITVVSRLNNVNTGGGDGAGNSELSNRVINVENYLYGNMTMVTNKLNNDLASATTTLSQNITDTRNYLEGRIATLPTTVGSGSGGGTDSQAVYANITTRLNNFENYKVQNLIDENNVWRRNFEVVNKTFSKLKKSSYSNDVIVVG